MALPIYRDITYYRGDTYVEKLYPKNADGTPFDLTDYQPYFVSDISRMFGSSAVEHIATIDTEENSITCKILPSTGASFGEGVYVYEVKIKKDSDPIVVYTLCTGALNVSANVRTFT